MGTLSVDTLVKKGYIQTVSVGIDGVFERPGGWGPWWKAGGPEQKLGTAELTRRGSPPVVLGGGGRASESVKVIPREVARLQVPHSD